MLRHMFLFHFLSISLILSGGKAHVGASVAFTLLQSSLTSLYYKEAQSLAKTTGPGSSYLLYLWYLFLRIPIIYGK